MRPLTTFAHVCVFIALSVAGCGRGQTTLDRAQLLAQKGREQEAMRDLRLHLAENPDALEERRLLIRLLGAVGAVGEAETEVQHLASRLPAESPLPWLELGHVLEFAHRYDEALSMYDRAAEVAPSDSRGPRTGGLRAARWGELELAAPRLEEALRRDPRDAEVWHALGVVRAHLRDWRGARTAYESGLVADPDAVENRIGLATLALRLGKPRAALEQYEAVTRARPRFADAHLGRSWALITMGRLEEAEGALEQSRRLGGDSKVIAAQTRLIRSLREKRESQKYP